MRAKRDKRIILGDCNRSPFFLYCKGVNCMSYYVRKSIRLKNYDYNQNGAYFVTICTQEKECLLGSIVGETLCGLPNNPHLIIEKWLLELENKFHCVKIKKYIIMPNHIHFIILFENEMDNHIDMTLSNIIDWYKTMTTNEYIRGVKNNLFPHFNKRIWQRSYYEHIIRNEKSYLEIWQYIDSNVISWKDDKLYVDVE